MLRAFGPAHSPSFRKDNGAKEDMKLGSLTVDRLGGRKTLLQSFDTLRRDIDNKHMMEGLDAFNQQALAMLTSSRLAEALNLEKEAKTTRSLWTWPAKKVADGSHGLLDDFLMARRLIEAGALCDAGF